MDDSYGRQVRAMMEIDIARRETARKGYRPCCRTPTNLKYLPLDNNDKGKIKLRCTECKASHIYCGLQPGRYSFG